MNLEDIKVVMGTKWVAGNNRGEVAAYVYHALGIGIAKVEHKWRTILDHGLLYRVASLVWAETG